MSLLFLYSQHCIVSLNNSELFHCLCLFFMSRHRSHKSKKWTSLEQGYRALSQCKKGIKLKLANLWNNLFWLWLLHLMQSKSRGQNITVSYKERIFSMLPSFLLLLLLSSLLQQKYSSRHQSWCDTPGRLWLRAVRAGLDDARSQRKPHFRYILHCSSQRNKDRCP